MTYFPRIRPRGARARYAGGMPASGAVAGMLAQRDRRGLWSVDEDADYSLRAALAPVLDVSVRDAQRLARHGINAFVHATGGSMRLVGRVTLAAAWHGSAMNASLERRRLGFFILNAIEEAAAAEVEYGDGDSALLRLEGQLTRFLDDLFERGALIGRVPAQAYYLHPDFGGASDGRRSIRLGFALYEPGRFVDYRIGLDGERAGQIQRLRALEAQQLFS